MTFKYDILNICLGLILMTGCGKEVSQEFNAYPNNPMNDTVWAVTLKPTDAANTMIADLMPNPDVATIDLSADEVSCKPGSTDSLRITFKKGIFTSFENGVITPVQPSGTAEVQVIRIRRNGDIIRYLRHTLSAGTICEMGSGLFIQVVKDGRILDLKAGEEFKIKLMETGAAPKPDMLRFTGIESSPPPLYNVYDPAFDWQRSISDPNIDLFFEVMNGRNVSGYEIKSNKFRWISAQRPVPLSTPDRKKVTVYFPPNFTNKTTNVYAVMANQKIVVRLNFDYNSRSFSTDKLPTNSKFRLVSISKIGNDFYMSESNVNDLTAAIVIKLDPKKIVKEKLQAYLDEL